MENESLVRNVKTVLNTLHFGVVLAPGHIIFVKSAFQGQITLNPMKRHRYLEANDELLSTSS